MVQREQGYQSAAPGQPYFSVFVKCSQGKPVRISRHICGADNAEAYVQTLWRAMGQGRQSQ